MKRHKKLLIYVLGPLGTAVILLAGLLWFWPSWMPWAVTQLTNRILKGEATVEIQSMEGKIRQEITLRGISIVSHSTGRKVEIRVKEIYAHYRLWDLLLQRFYFDTLKIEEPRLTLQTLEPDTLIKKGKHSFQVDFPEFKVPGYNVKVKQLYLNDARCSFHFNDNQFTIDSLFASLQASIGAGNMDLNLQHLSATWPDRNFRLSRFAFHFNVDKDGWSFKDWEIQSNAADLHGFGAVTLSKEKQVGIHFSSDSIDVAKIASMVNRSNDLTGFLNFDLQIQGNEDALKLIGHAGGTIEPYHIEKGYIRANLYPKILSIDSVLLQVNRASVHGKVTVHTDERFQSQIRFDGVNLNQMDPRRVSTNLGGSINFEGKGFDFHRMTSKIEVIVDTLEYRHFPLGEIRFFAKVNQGRVQIADSTKWILNNNVMTAGGWFQTNQDVNFEILIHQIKLEEVVQAFEIGETSGTLVGNFQISGSLRDPTVRSDLLVQKFVMQKLALDTVHTKIDVEKLMSDRKGVIIFRTSSGKLGPVPITAGDGTVVAEGKRIFLKALKLYNANDYVYLNGVVTTGDEQTFIEFSDVRVVYQNYDLQNMEPIAVLITPDGIGVERIEFLTPGGQLRFGGTYFKPDSLYFFGAVENFDLKPISNLTNLSIPIAGFLNYQFSFQGTLKNPNLELEMSLHQASIDSIPIQELKIDGSYMNHKFILNQLTAIQDSARLIARGEAMIPIDLSDRKKKNILSISDIDFRVRIDGIDVRTFERYHHQKKLKSGKFDSEISLSGSLADLRGNLKVRSRDLRFKDLLFQRLSLDGRFTNQEFKIDSLAIGVSGLPIFAQGSIPFNLSQGSSEKELFPQSMKVGVRVKSNDLSIVSNLFQDQIEDINGSLDADFQISGNPLSPIINGSGSFKINNTLLIQLYNEPKNITGNFEINQNVLRFSRTQGYASGNRRGSQGKFTVDGSVDITHPIRPLMNLSIQGKDVYYEDPLGEIQAYTDLDLKVTGRDTITTKGSILVNDVLISSNFDDESSSSTLISAESPYLAMDIGVTLPRSIHVKNNDMDIWLDGYLHMIVPPNQDYYFLGQLEIFKSGKYIFPPDIFTVREAGKIVFDQPGIFDPKLDVKAELLKQGISVVIKMGGTLNYPNMQFLVYDKDGKELPWSQGEIMNFLGTSRIAAQSADDSTGSVSTGAMISEQAINRGLGIANSFLEKQIARSAGLDEFSFGNEKTGLAQAVVQNNYNQLLNEQFTIGKQLGRSFYLRFSSSLTDISKMSLNTLTTHTARLGIEYRISRYFSVIGGFEKDESSQTLSNVWTMDLLFRYEY